MTVDSNGRNGDSAVLNGTASVKANGTTHGHANGSLRTNGNGVHKKLQRAEETDEVS